MVNFLFSNVFKLDFAIYWLYFKEGKALKAYLNQLIIRILERKLQKYESL